MVKDKELELEKIKAEQDQKLHETENELLKKIKDLEDEIHDQEERNKSELEQATNKDKYNDLEEAIHQKTCHLQNLEANQQAEEALLKVWLEAVTDKERHLREEAAAKQGRYAEKISQLESELMNARQKAESEQRQYDQLKEDIENKLQEKRSQFESHTREAAAHLNDLNNQIAELKRSLKTKEEAAKDRGDSVDKRIKSETTRLNILREELEKQIGPLKTKHNDLKHKLINEKEKHEQQLQILQDEQEQQSREQEEELNRLYNLQEKLRLQFKEERRQLQQSLKEILDTNDTLREKHEKEIFDLNMRLVQTLQATSSEKIDAEATQELLEKVKKLQKDYAEKSREFEDLKLQHNEEFHELSERNETEIRELKQDIVRLSKDYLKDGVKDPVERVSRLKEMLEQKDQELNKVREEPLKNSEETNKLLEEINDAKAKNEELSEQLKQKKKELGDLMNERQREMAAPSSREARDHGKGDDSEGSLRDRLDTIQELRGQVGEEQRENEKLSQELSRLQGSKHQQSNVRDIPHVSKEKHSTDPNVGSMSKQREEKRTLTVKDSSSKPPTEEPVAPGRPSLETIEESGHEQSEQSIAPALPQQRHEKEDKPQSRKKDRISSLKVSDDSTLLRINAQSDMKPVEKTGLEDESEIYALSALRQTSEPIVTHPPEKDPGEMVLDMVYAKKQELRELEEKGVEVDHCEIEKIQKLLEDLQGQLPGEYEKLTSHTERIQTLPPREGETQKRLTSKQTQAILMTGNRDLTVVGRNFDKVLSVGGSRPKENSKHTTNKAAYSVQNDTFHTNQPSAISHEQVPRPSVHRIGESRIESPSEASLDDDNF